MHHRAALERVLAWGRCEDNIRVVVLTGSVARGETAFDDLSDLDLELYVRDPSALLDRDDWYRQFGEVLVVEALDNPEWHPTRLVYYADGKIDFMIASATVLARGVSYDRPFQVLLDKDNIGESFRRRSPRTPPPGPAEFLRCVHEFHAAAIMWAKHLARNDPWAVRVRDWDSKSSLLLMLEWDQKARKGWDLETWQHAARLREWVDPDLKDAVDACLSGFEPRDSARALRASLSMFETLSARTAIALGFEPFDASGVRRRVEELLAGA